MQRRTSRDTLRSLRITLQKLEQNFDDDKDASAMVELKRILLNRIAELELVSALASDHPDQMDTPDPAGLPATSAGGRGGRPEAAWGYKRSGNVQLDRGKIHSSSTRQSNAT